MATAKKGLGRGLSALIPDSDMEFLSRVARGDASLPAIPVAELEEMTEDEASDRSGAPISPTRTPLARSGQFVSAPNARTSQASSDGPVWLDTTQIEANPYQPRRTFSTEEMNDLISSVREHGIIQPILVRPTAGVGDTPAYQLIAGERRWRAAQEAGLTRVPAVIRTVSDQQALELALIENVQRHDISAMDAAKAYRRLADEFGLSQEDIARRVGKSRPAIANTMRLLDLPDEAQKAIEDGTITEGHGRAILLAPGDGARRAVFRRVLRDKVTVREAEEMARKSQSVREESSTSETTDSKQARLSSVEVRALRATEEELSKMLGTRVRVRPRAKGGQICIEYFSSEDLDQLLGRLRGRQ
jgi:ParB family chromosome partitioning protein